MRNRIVILAVAGLWALSARALADPCSEGKQRLAAGVTPEVEYSARVFDAGYRFSIGGLSWELVRTPFRDVTGKRRFAVTHPVIVDDDTSSAVRDFFLSVRTRESDGAACNDIKFLEENPVHRLRVRDDRDSVIRFGDLDRKAKRLVATRRLGTELRLRIDGTELLIETGFATQRSLNIAGCASGFDDSFGFVEYQPGQVQVTCFPADPENRDYIGEIDWHVDYQWPRNPPAVIDELIDYVYVEPL